MSVLSYVVIKMIRNVFVEINGDVIDYRLWI